MVSQCVRFPRAGRLFPRKRAYDYSRIFPGDSEDDVWWEDHENRLEFSVEPTSNIEPVPDLETNEIHEMKAILDDLDSGLASNAIDGRDEVSIDSPQDCRDDQKSTRENNEKGEISEHQNRSSSDHKRKTIIGRLFARRKSRGFSRVLPDSAVAWPDSTDVLEVHENCLQFKEGLPLVQSIPHLETNEIQEKTTLLDDLTFGLASQIFVYGRDEESIVSSQYYGDDQKLTTQAIEKDKIVEERDKSSSNRKSKTVLGRLFHRKKARGFSRVISDSEDHDNRLEFSVEPTDVESVPDLGTNQIQKKTTLLDDLAFGLASNAVDGQDSTVSAQVDGPDKKSTSQTNEKDVLTEDQNQSSSDRKSRTLIGRFFIRKKARGCSRVLPDPEVATEDHENRQECSEEPTVVESLPNLETTDTDQPPLLDGNNDWSQAAARNVPNKDKEDPDKVAALRKQKRQIESCVKKRTNLLEWALQEQAKQLAELQSGEEKQKKEFIALERQLKSVLEQVHAEDAEMAESQTEARSMTTLLKKCKQKSGRDTVNEEDGDGFAPGDRVRRRLSRQRRIIESFNPGSISTKQPRKHGRKARKKRGKTVVDEMTTAESTSTVEMGNKETGKEKQQTDEIQREMTVLNDLTFGLASQAVDGQDSIASSQYCRRDQMPKSNANKKGSVNEERIRSSSYRSSKNKILMTISDDDENSLVDSEVTGSTASMSIYSERTVTAKTSRTRRRHRKPSKFVEGMCYCQILDCLHR